MNACDLRRQKSPKSGASLSIERETLSQKRERVGENVTAQRQMAKITDNCTRAGFCIKTNSSEGKVFINICHSPSIPPPVDVTEDELLQMLEEDQAGFRIPMSLGEPHAELDASQCPQKTPLCSPSMVFLRAFQSALGARGVQT